MAQRPPQDSGTSGWALGGLGLAMVACCALPLLIAGGALGGIGALLGNPWLIVVAALVVGVGLGWRLRHRA